MKKNFKTLLLVVLTVIVIGCNKSNGGGEGKQTASEFSWYETPVVLPAGTDGTCGKKATYVYFGVWPQTVVSEADVAGLSLDESAATTVERGSFKYVQGSDGHYYVKYEGEWYKVMPIKWRIADNEYDVDGNAGSSTAKLLVAEKVLTGNMPYYEEYEHNRTIGSKTVYPNNYMHSQIRAYLNGYTYTGYDTSASSNVEKSQWNKKGFLQTAFTSTAIASIITTKVDNSDVSTTDIGNNITKATEYACDPTDDKIFLLSEYEVTKYSKEAYDSTGKGNSRIRATTDFAKANNAYDSKANGNSCNWWLRSPNYNLSSGARFVTYNGYAGLTGYDFVGYINYGVVPALCIEMQ